MQKIQLIILVILGALLSACSGAKPALNSSVTNPASNVFNHQALDELLAKNVDEHGRVNYAALGQERTKLDTYLATLAPANVAQFPNDAERLAFWINAYNAFTLADVLDDVYGKQKSVNDHPDKFFRGKKHKIASEELTLDEIEKRGRDLKDPRIHFAVVCASASCPKLQRFAFTGEKLDWALTKLAREFLGDAARGMRYDAAKNIMYLSPIFKWYAADFTDANNIVARVKAETSGAELLDAAKKYIPYEVQQFLNEKNPKVDYLPYDWSLNAQAAPPQNKENEKK